MAKVFAALAILLLTFTSLGACGEPEAAISAGEVVHLKIPKAEYIWVHDPNDMDWQKEEADVIIKARYTGKSHCEKIFESEYVIHTAYTVDVLEVYKGDLSDEQIDIYVEGGEMSLKEYRDNSTIEGVDTWVWKASDKELKGSTIEMESDNDISLKKGDIILVYLYGDAPYVVLFGGISLYDAPNELALEDEYGDVIEDLEQSELN